MNAYIILDIGGTFTRCAVFTDKSGLEPVAVNKNHTVEEDESAVERIISVIREMWPSDCTVKGISIAAPGSIDVNSGTVILAPNIHGWSNIPLREIISRHFNVDILVNNDARLAAIGEWRRGAGIGHENLLYFTISTGVGGGVIYHGQLLEGDFGIATELGHITIDENGPMCGCGHRGHIEAFSSGTAIRNYYLEQTAGTNERSGITARVISEYARQGKTLAVSAFERAGYYLGIGVANYLHIFNPSCVIFGGGVSLSADLFMDAFRKSLESHVISDNYIKNLTITLASLGDNAGLIGALEYLKEKIGD
jgi:glucokinase